jgi:hypothetical protein
VAKGCATVRFVNSCDLNLPLAHVQVVKPPGFDPLKLKDYLEIAGFDEYAGSFKARLALTFKKGGYTIR